MNLYLGTELVGMNGVISNVIAMLSVTELGISTAIVYHLYSALVNKDETRNSSFDESISQSVLYVCSHSSCARVNDYAFCSSIYEKMKAIRLDMCVCCIFYGCFAQLFPIRSPIKNRF